MKKMLKYTAIIVCLVLVALVLTGCGTEDIKNKVETIINEEKEAAEEEKVFERGKWEDNVYKNEFANITFKLPEGWTYSSDEEIAEMMNIGVEALNDNQQAMSKLAEQTSVYDMVSNDPNTGASVMVMFEKPLMKVSTDFYIDKLKTGLEEVDSIDYTIGDVTTESIAGEEYTVLTTTVPAYNMVQKYYIKTEGNYFIDVLVTYIESLTEPSSIMNNFQ